MLAIWRGAVPERRHEIGFAPGADAVARIGRYVGDVEGAERRGEREPAAEPRAVDLVGIPVRRRMAGRAAADVEHGAAVGEIGRMGRRQVAGVNRYRNREDIEHRGDEDCHRHRERRQQRSEHPHRPFIRMYDRSTLRPAGRTNTLSFSSRDRSGGRSRSRSCRYCRTRP